MPTTKHADASNHQVASTQFVESPNYAHNTKEYGPYLVYSRTDPVATAFARVVVNELKHHGITAFDPGQWDDVVGVPIGATENVLKKAHEARAHAMAHCQFCLVILSSSFYYNDVAFLEIRSVVARETRENVRKYIVPVCWRPNLLEDDMNDLNKLLKARRGIVKEARPREFFLHTLMPPLVQHCVALEKARDPDSSLVAKYDPDAARDRLDKYLKEHGLNAADLFRMEKIPVMDFKDRASSEEEKRALTGLNVVVQQQHKTMTILHDERPNETAEKEERERAKNKGKFFDRPDYDFIILYGLSPESQRHARAHSAILESLGFVVFLEAKSVPPGKSLLAAVRHALKRTPGCLCVVDNSFKQSRWAVEELAQLRLRGHENNPAYKHPKYLRAPVEDSDEDTEAADDEDTTSNPERTSSPDSTGGAMDVSEEKTLPPLGSELSAPTTAGTHCHIRVVRVSKAKLHKEQPSPLEAVLPSNIVFGKPDQEVSSAAGKKDDEEMSTDEDVEDDATTSSSGDSDRRPYSERAVMEVPHFATATKVFLDGAMNDPAADAALREKIRAIMDPNPAHTTKRLGELRKDLLEECHLICEQVGYYPSERDVLLELGFDGSPADRAAFLGSLTEERVCDMLVRVRNGTKKKDKPGTPTDRPEREHFPLTAGVFYVLDRLLQNADPKMGSSSPPSSSSSSASSSSSSSSSTTTPMRLTGRILVLLIMQALKWCWLEECFAVSGRLMKRGQADRDTFPNRAYLCYLFHSLQRVQEAGVRRQLLFQPNEWGVPPISEFYYHDYLGALLVLKEMGDLNGDVFLLTGAPLTVEDPQDVSKRCFRVAFTKYGVFAEEFPSKKFDADQRFQQIIQCACIAVGRVYTKLTHNKTRDSKSVKLTDKQEAFVKQLVPSMEHVRSESTREGFGTCAVAHMVVQPRMKDAAKVLATFEAAQELNQSACELWKWFRIDLDTAVDLLKGSDKKEIPPQKYTSQAANHVILFTNKLTNFFSLLANVRIFKLQNALFECFLGTCHPRFGKICKDDKHCLVEALMAWTLFLWGGAGGYRPTAVRIVKGRRDQLLLTFGLRNHYELRLKQIIKVYVSGGKLADVAADKSAASDEKTDADAAADTDADTAARKQLVQVLRNLRLDDAKLPVGHHIADWVHGLLLTRTNVSPVGPYLLDQARRLETVITQDYDDQKNPVFEAVLSAAKQIHDTEGVDLLDVTDALRSRIRALPAALEVARALRKLMRWTYSKEPPQTPTDWDAFRQMLDQIRKELTASCKGSGSNFFPESLLSAFEVGQPIDDQLRTVEQCAQYVKEELDKEQALPQHLTHLRDSAPDTYKRVLRAYNRWWGWVQMTWRWLDELAEGEEECVVAAGINGLNVQDSTSGLSSDDVQFMLQVRPVVDALENPPPENPSTEQKHYYEPVPILYRRGRHYESWKVPNKDVGAMNIDAAVDNPTKQFPTMFQSQNVSGLPVH